MRTGTLKKLKATQLRSLNDGVHSDGGGLYLKSKGNRQSWIFRFTVDGKKREMGLGPLATVSLSTARDLAAQARDKVARGMDPITARKDATPSPNPSVHAITFKAAIDRHIQRNKAEWSSAKHAKVWENSLRTHANTLLERDVSTITIHDAEDILAPIWTVKPDTARRVRQRCERVMAGCIVRKEHPGPNPFAWRDNLEVLLAKVSRVRNHHGMVAVEDAPEVMATMMGSDALGAKMNILIAHTALRSGTARTLEWNDIQVGMIVVPSERMKSRKTHRIPISNPLASFLKDLPRFNTSPLVIPGSAPGRPMSDMTASKYLKGIYPGAVVHGWRSTFRTWAAREGYDRLLAEDMLSHSLGDNDVEAAYLRGDLAEQRREMCGAWSSYLVSVK